MIARTRLAAPLILATLWSQTSGGPSGASPPVAEGSAPESRIGELHLAAQDRLAAKDWEGAHGLVREIVALDPHHPKAYLLVVQVQQRRADLAGTGAELDRLGLRSEAGRLYARGVVAVMERRHEEARDLLERALHAYDASPHGAGLAACHTALGNLERRLDRSDRAAVEYVAALDLLSRIGDRPGQADVLSSLAKLERDAGHAAAAAAHQRKILEIRRALGDEDGQGRSLHEIGVCLMEAGDLRGAREALDEALVLRRRRADRPGEITTLRVIAQVAAKQGDVTVGLEKLGEARAVAASLPDARQEAEILRQAGEVSLGSSRDAEAFQACDEAATRFGSLQEAGQEAGAALCAATALNRLGEFHRAEARLEEIRSRAGARSEKSIEASALTELTVTTIAQGDFLGALNNAERALALHVELKNARGQSTDQNNLGAAYHHLGDTTRALRAMEASLRLAEESADPHGQTMAHINLGVLLAERGEPENALRHLESAERMAASRRLRAAAWSGIAEIEIRAGRIEEAGRRLEEALALLRDARDQVAVAPFLDQKGGLLRLQGRWSAAQEAHEQARELARRFGLSEDEWRARWGLAACAGGRARVEEGIAQGLAAIDGIERARSRLGPSVLRMRYLADRIGPHETVVELLLGDARHASEDRIARAFHVAERSRARTLLDQIAETEARRLGRIDPAMVQAESLALDRIGRAMVQLASSRDDVDRAAERLRIDEAEEELRRLEDRYRSPTSGPPAAQAPVTVARLQEVLGEGEALLAYFLGQQSGRLWTITHDRARVWPVPGAPALEADVAAWHHAVAGLGGAFDDKAEALGAALARRILPGGSVPARARLLIVPDGPLHQIPFEALPLGGGPLVESHETAVLPSASVLWALRRSRREARGSGYLGVGPPPPTAGDAALPAARREVARVAQLFPETQRTVLQDGGASRSALESLDLSRFRFIHFATHGWIDPSDPRHSGLRLRGEDDAESLLSLPEIQMQRLQADLVVLSACETARGERLRGEGVTGLARAFLRAGAMSVIVSLWDVNDESTADFMETFYEEMLAGRDASSALRRAKLAFLQSDRPARRAASRWAPFVLVGEPETGTR